MLLIPGGHEMRLSPISWIADLAGVSGVVEESFVTADRRVETPLQALKETIQSSDWPQRQVISLVPYFGISREATSLGLPITLSIHNPLIFSAGRAQYEHRIKMMAPSCVVVRDPGHECGEIECGETLTGRSVDLEGEARTDAETLLDVATMDRNRSVLQRTSIRYEKEPFR